MDDGRLAQGMIVKVGLAVFGLATLAILVLSLVSDRGVRAARERGERLAGLEQEIEELETENASMIEEIQTLKTDPAEIERRAREELKLVLPGEVILVVPNEEQFETN